MKKDQVHTFKIDHSLTAQTRRSVEEQIEENAKSTEEPVGYDWDENDADQLHIDVGPVKLDVIFYDDFVEVYVDAPLWARVVINKEKEAALRDLVHSILTNAKLIDAEKSSQA